MELDRRGCCFQGLV